MLYVCRENIRCCSDNTQMQTVFHFGFRQKVVCVDGESHWLRQHIAHLCNVTTAHAASGFMQAMNQIKSLTCVRRYRQSHRSWQEWTGKITWVTSTQVHKWCVHTRARLQFKTTQRKYSPWDLSTQVENPSAVGSPKSQAILLDRAALVSLDINQWKSAESGEFPFDPFQFSNVSPQLSQIAQKKRGKPYFLSVKIVTPLVAPQICRSISQDGN